MRYTGASVGYQLASVFGGGFAPLIAVALLAAGDDKPTSGGLLHVGMALITVVATLFARETFREDIADAVPRGRAGHAALRAQAGRGPRAGARRRRVTNETIFTLEATPIKFGAGASPTPAGSSSASAPRG